MGIDSAVLIAQTYAFRGELDPAFAWLDRAYEARISGIGGVRSSRWYRNLHQDARWDALLEKLGLAD